MERASSAAFIRPLNSPRQVLFASLIGTTIEFFDFYIYVTAALLAFLRLLFPKSDPASVTLAVLVLLGLYVRLTITETPVFREALKRHDRVNVPMLVVFRDHAGTLVLGILVSLSAFVVFYLMTVFALSWGTSALGYSREQFLVIQLFAMLFFALFIPISAVLAERGRRRMLMCVNVAIGAFGLVMAPLFAGGTAGAVTMMVSGMSLMGLVYGPLGTVLSELFPTTVRYSGSSL